VSVTWLAESLEDGVLAARVGRDGDRLVAEWPGRLHLSVKRDGTELVLEPQPEVGAAELEKLKRGAVRLLLGHLAGAVPLHASAVAIDGRAVVFVGGTGLGKSTLAAALCDRCGGSLLADDAVVIERRGDVYEVLAVERTHWLDHAAATTLGRPGLEGAGAPGQPEKAPLAARRIDVPHAPLAMIAHLAFRDDAEVARLVPVEGLDAVAGLLSQLTRFVVDEPAVARRDLGLLADLVDRTRIVRLERPRQLDMLWETATLVAAAVHGDGS
jgi:hypothetical protein